MITPGETAAPVEPSAPPDWATVTQDILCPLCDYNLRGLVEPRCPECGHRSSWQDLLNPNRGDHRWLFEHHHGKRIRSFIRTLWESQFVHRFWRSVRPTHVPSPKRLVIYWFVVVCLVAMSPFVAGLVRVSEAYTRLYHMRERERSDFAKWIATTQASPNSGSTLRIRARNPYAQVQAMGINNYLDTYYAYPSPIQAIRGNMYSSFYGEPAVPVVLLTVVAGYALWPWITTMALLIFRQTMKQAKIKPVHVVRCAIYSADAGILLALIVAPVLLWRTSVANPGENVLIYSGLLFDPVSFLILIAAAIVLTWRLSIAYREYLGFPQAIATCALAQCITLMALFGLYLWLPLA